MLDALSWTQVSNTFINALPELSGAETKIMIAIFRKTIGWQKNVDVMSISQLSGLTGIKDRKTISDALRALEKLEWVRVTRSKKGSKVDLLMGENPPLTGDGGRIIQPPMVGKSNQEWLDNPPHKRKERKETNKYIESGGKSSSRIPIKEAAEKLVSYLNQRTGRDFRADADAVVRGLAGRAEEGYTAAQIGQVIAYMCDKRCGTEWEEFLRPTTLFNKTKFYEYFTEWEYQSKQSKEESANNAGKKDRSIENLADA